MKLTGDLGDRLITQNAHLQTITENSTICPTAGRGNCFTQIVVHKLITKVTGGRGREEVENQVEIYVIDCVSFSFRPRGSRAAEEMPDQVGHDGVEVSHDRRGRA